MEITIDEIKRALAQSALEAKRKGKHNGASPYSVMPDHVKEGIELKKKKEQAKKKKLKSQPTAEELMNFYAAQSNVSPYNSDEVMLKSINMPYADTIMRVQEYMSIEEKNTKSSQHLLADPVVDKAEHLKNRFPRLCKKLSFNSEDVACLNIRSDIWLVRIIESCYDEAFLYCNKQGLSDSRRRKRCGLDLGALDAFPLVAHRLISRTYSVMAMRTKVCLEMLITLESGLAKVIAQKYAPTGTFSAITGGRLELFAKFLSEEYDLDYLAIFLQNRERIQCALNVKLKDINQARIWSDTLEVDDPTAANVTSSGNGNSSSNIKRSSMSNVKSTAAEGGKAAVSAAVKITPVVLPSNLQFIEDLALPEAPLLGFDSSLLASYCNAAAPAASIKERLYLAERVVEYYDQQLSMIDRSGMQSLNNYIDNNNLNNNNNFNEPGSPARRGGVATGFFIPIYSFLIVLCVEWFNVPVESKVLFGAQGVSEESFRDLNSIYQKDCDMMRSLKKSILDSEAEMTDCDGRLTKLNKNCRRLERKWHGNIATADELMNLQEIRVAITEATAERSSIQAKHSQLKQQDIKLEGKIDDLWKTATFSTFVDAGAVVPPPKKGMIQSDTSTQATETTMIAAPTWQDEITKLLQLGLQYNFESRQQIVAARREMEELDSAKEDVQELALPVIEDTVPREPTIEEMLAELEREANALACVGHNEALELGMAPPPPPLWMQEIQQKENMELEMKQLRLKEIEVERMNSVLMHSEDELSRKLELIQMQIDIADRRRAEEDEAARKLHEEKLIKTMQELQAQAVTMSKEFAKAEMEKLIATAVRDIAEAVMLKKISEFIDDESSSSSQQISSDSLLCNELKKEQENVQRELVVGCIADREIQLAIEAAIAETTNYARTQLEIQLEREKLAIEESEKMQVATATICRTAIAQTQDVITCAVNKRVEDHIRLAQEANIRRAKEILWRQQQLQMAMIQHHEDQQQAKQLYLNEIVSDLLDSIVMQATMSSAQLLQQSRDMTIDDAVETICDSTMENIFATSVDNEVTVAIDNYWLEVDKNIQIQRQADIEHSVITSIAHDLLDEVIYELCVDDLILRAMDPWSSLNDDPESWLSEDVLASVEELYMVACMKNSYLQKKQAFLSWICYKQKSQKIQLFMKQRLSNVSREVLKTIRKYNLQARKQGYLVKKIQRWLRARMKSHKRKLFADHIRQCHVKSIEFANLQRKNRLSLYVDHWLHMANAAKKGKSVVDCITDRRFIRTYYTWKLHFKNHRTARLAKEKLWGQNATVIQCMIRQRLARAKRLRKISCRKIVCAARCYLNRRRVGRVIRKLQYQDECATFILAQHHRRVNQKTWKKWNHSNVMAIGLQKCDKWFRKIQFGRIYYVWKAKSLVSTMRRTVKSTMIQSCVRMWLVKKHVLNYYKWRRAMRLVQSHMRRRIAFARYEIKIYYFRKARSIQRIYRGFAVRNHLTDSRIIDLHYASTANNYEKLLYYCTKYPELLHELDNEGNTALHNAAKTASRRTLKLLLRQEFDANALNLQGHTSLHLVIMASAINRDDCFLYMWEHGFDEDIRGPNGQSCLLLACQYGRTAIAKHLMKHGMNPDIPDNDGTTCLQAACTHGYYAIAKEVIENGANVNLGGYCGTFPLHDCIATGSVDLPKLLLSHGAYLNVFEPFHKQTPLMWAAQSGNEAILRLYLLQGANVSAKDDMGWTVAHHCARPDNALLYDCLREADVNFDALDNQGNTPLHVAVDQGALHYSTSLLQGGAIPSHQNAQGNQPAHLAARGNYVEILKQICLYDEHIGRLNFAHQTPLGIAKFHSAKDTQRFLEEHYKRVEVSNGRNSLGEIWWDKEVDNLTSEWDVVVTDMNDRSYVNKFTGERTTIAPRLTAKQLGAVAAYNQVPLKRTVEMVKDGSNLTKHGYLKEYVTHKEDVDVLGGAHRAAICIGKFMRRKLAYKERKHLQLIKSKRRILGRFFRHRLPNFKRWKYNLKCAKATKIESLWRGYSMRKQFYTNPKTGDHVGTPYEALWYRRWQLQLRLRLWKLWKNWQCRKLARYYKILTTKPKTLYDWQPIVDQCRRPRRVVGMFEEYVYPGTQNIYFFRHAMTGNCQFDKPKKMKYLDDLEFLENQQRLAEGGTHRQIALAIKIQAMWRGYQIRSYYVYVETAMKISMTAESNYLTHPDKDSYLINYALHCHTILHDYTRARKLYCEALRRMEWRGPDVAIILYAYSIFAFVTHDQDFSDLLMLLHRARKAEETREIQVRKRRGEIESLAITKGTFRHGKVFEFANDGFFKSAATTQESGPAWHNYAVCRFLVFESFTTSFDAFLTSFKYDGTEPHMKANFDVMMQYFHGTDKQHLADIVRERMRLIAGQDDEIANTRTQRRELAQQRAIAANRIKVWYKRRKSIKGFYKFLKNLHEAKAAQSTMPKHTAITSTRQSSRQASRPHTTASSRRQSKSRKGEPSG